MEVSVRELKNRLSAYLRRAQQGEEIIVTSHGKPVGRLVAPARSSDADAETRARLRVQPWARPGSGAKLRGARRPIQVRKGEHLTKTLLDRE